jgi:hypothetical protein
MTAKKKSSGQNHPPAPTSAPLRREDRPGHFDPKYAASLRALGSHAKDEDRAFVGGSRAGDDLAEELAEEAVVAMTTGEDNLRDDLEAETDDEQGGPFVTSTAREEYAGGTDASNPLSATREPFPKT